MTVSRFVSTIPASAQDLRSLLSIYQDYHYTTIGPIGVIYALVLFMIKESTMKVTRQEGFKEAPSYKLTELEDSTLEKLCDEFRENVFKFANKHMPPR